MSKEDRFPGYLGIGKQATLICEGCNAVFAIINEPEDHVQEAPGEFPESEIRMIGFCPFCGDTNVYDRNG